MMILIPRTWIRQFRSVLQQAGFYKGRTSRSHSIRLVAQRKSMTLQANNGRVAIEFKLHGLFDIADLTVPLAMFEQCEAKSNDIVTIRRSDIGNVVATWKEDGVPQQANFSSVSGVDLPQFATKLTPNPPSLLRALREAVSIVGSATVNYALDCLQLDGATGAIAATDWLQLFVVERFSFPWSGVQLMQTSGVFTSKELSLDRAVEIGRTESGITVRIGPWTIHHHTNMQARYPNVSNVIPSDGSIRTRLQLNQEDAGFLIERIERLPTNNITNQPVTLELDGSVIVRARRDDNSPTMELVLSRSHYRGEPRRININRQHFVRAHCLGFREIGFVDEKSPCICQALSRAYLWMPLDNGAALPPDPGAIRIESGDSPSRKSPIICDSSRRTPSSDPQSNVSNSLSVIQNATQPDHPTRFRPGLGSDKHCFPDQATK